MPYTVDFKEVSTTGLETSPHSDALAGLRADDARYYMNKYKHALVTRPATDAPELLTYVQNVLNERDIHFAAKPLEVAQFEVGGLKMTHVYYEDGLGINVMYALDDGGKRAVGFKLSQGMDVPQELADKFKFARRKSKLAGEIRGSFFVIKGTY